MLPAVIAYPQIDPVAISLGPLPIRWYALAYIAGLLLGWAYARKLVRDDRLWGALPRPDVLSLDDLLVYAALGVVAGGRLGYVLGVWIFARRTQTSALTVADLCSAVVPIGLFLGRIANFIKPELWGRESDVDWAMVFPEAGPLPRHPSQLYEAGLEGIALFIVLLVVVRMGALRRPGLATGVFAIGYGLTRIFCEFFREPDPQLGFLFGGATMGMLLSLPLIAIGAGFVLHAQRQARAS